MLTLSNDQLVVSVLHPVEDRVRLGSRYCVGGYVYDVTDRRLGPITSGPGYPDEVYPPVFDGQGLPEAFPSPLWLGMFPGDPDTRPAPGAPVLVIGVGMVETTTADKIREMPTQEFCPWQINQTATTMRMTTRQAYAGWELSLTRDLTLSNRTLISATRLANLGRDPISFRWFPHPFFPNPRGECCKFNLAVSMPENPGYRLLENGFIEARPEAVWDRQGHFQVLTFSATDRLVTAQRHPALGLLTATCSYTPSWLPIWGNRNTFSFEPYLSRTVEPGAETNWSMSYDF